MTGNRLRRFPNISRKNVFLIVIYAELIFFRDGISGHQVSTIIKVCQEKMAATRAP